MNKSRLFVATIGVIIVVIIAFSLIFQWALTIDYVQSPIKIETQKAIIYRKESKEYQKTMMKQKANEAIKIIDKYFEIYPQELPTPTPTPETQEKAEITPISSTVESFPKFLTDVGFSNREHAMSWASQFFTDDDLVAFDNILKKESGYRASALNEIGAGGICQAYPASKMGCDISEEALLCQLEWCKNYITQRYGTPSKAWEFHLANNWF